MIFDIVGGSTELVLVEAGGPEASRVPRHSRLAERAVGVVSLTTRSGRSEGGGTGRAPLWNLMRRLVKAESFAPFAGAGPRWPRAMRDIPPARHQRTR